jgi:hypothetical protein
MASMIAFRNAACALICDGCFSLLAMPSADGHLNQAKYRHRTSDGREGHVCDQQCADRFEATPPRIAVAERVTPGETATASA